jgi:acyl carrier protein
MTSSDSFELELKRFIISTLALEDLMPEDIESDMPLFGEGLGLDSVDALELGVALQKNYQVRIDPSDQETRKHFASVSSLAAFVAREREVQQASS